MRRAYIAGKMRGVPLYNYGAFDAARDELLSLGYEVVSPADLDRAIGLDPAKLPADWDWNTLPDGFDLRETAKRDLDALLTCDAIYLLPGWEQSKGATAEYQVARWLGLERIDGHQHETVLAEATRITSGDRDGDYGHPADHWQMTVGMINARFGLTLKPEDFGAIMVMDKLARDAHRPKRDNLTDICGYARCIEKVRARLRGRHDCAL